MPCISLCTAGYSVQFPDIWGLSNREIWILQTNAMKNIDKYASNKEVRYKMEDRRTPTEKLKTIFLGKIIGKWELR